MNTTDYFRDITLFRRHPYDLGLDKDTSESIAYWTNRRAHHQVITHTHIYIYINAINNILFYIAFTFDIIIYL